MTIPVEEIRKGIRPDRYGLKKQLLKGLYRKPIYGICIKKPSKPFEDGYWCLDAAIRVNEILQKHDINSHVWAGKDEKDLWAYHYFVITDDGVKVDATPPYKIVGAGHIPKDQISKEEIEKFQSEFIPLNSLVLDSLVPLRYKKSNKTAILSRTGIGYDFPPTKISLHLILLKDRNPIQECEVTASFDTYSLSNLLYEWDITPSNMSMDEMMKEFERLVNGKTVELTGRSYDLKLHRPGFLERTKIDVNEVNPELKKEIDEDMDVLVYLVESIPLLVI